MELQKVELRWTVLVAASTPGQAHATLREMSPEDIARETDEGAMVGSLEVVSATTVPSDQVEHECQALGSDASFFDSELGVER